MKRKLCLLILLPLSIELQAQTTQTDSVSIKTKMAKNDARHFKLTQENWLAYKKHRIANTSDFFKPNAADVSRPDLLSDSVYVKAYRASANKRTLKRRSAGHYILIAGGIFVAAVGISVIVFSAIFYSSLV